MIAKGAEANAKNRSGQTPLHEAAYYGHHECIKVLIKNNADIDAEDNLNNRPINYAVAMSHFESVQTLISSGANVNYENLCCESPLQCATQKNYDQIVKLLVENGAEIAPKGRIHGRPTALHLAASKNDLKCRNTVRIFVERKYECL